MLDTQRKLPELIMARGVVIRELRAPVASRVRVAQSKITPTAMAKALLTGCSPGYLMNST